MKRWTTKMIMETIISIMENRTMMTMMAIMKGLFIENIYA